MLNHNVRKHGIMDVKSNKHTKGRWKRDVEIRHETWLLRFDWHRADHALIGWS